MYAVRSVADDLPGSCYFVVVVVFNMLGDSIRDILDPRNE